MTFLDEDRKPLVSVSKDELGDRMKELESVYTEIRLPEDLPVYARIDGRSFSKLTKNLERPFDVNFHACMVKTTEYLVEQTHALAGFTQSDEISLVWAKPDWFSGKVTKMSSVLSGMASSKFMHSIDASDDYHGRVQALQEYIPHFDARVFSLPSQTEAANAMLWRVLDCEKNSTSMAAHHYFSHKSLQGQNSQEMRQRLAELDHLIDSFPAAFVHGTWVRRYLVQHPLTNKELDGIPAAHRPSPDTLFDRHVIKSAPCPEFRTWSIDEKVAWLFR